MLVKLELKSEEELYAIQEDIFLNKYYKQYTQHDQSKSIKNDQTITVLEVTTEIRYLEHFIKCAKTCVNLKELNLNIVRNKLLQTRLSCTIGDILELLNGVKLNTLQINHYDLSDISSIVNFVNNNDVQNIIIVGNNMQISIDLILCITKSVNLEFSTKLNICEQRYKYLLNHLDEHKIRLKCDITCDDNKFNTDEYLTEYYNENAKEYSKYFIEKSDSLLTQDKIDRNKKAKENVMQILFHSINYKKNAHNK